LGLAGSHELKGEKSIMNEFEAVSKKIEEAKKEGWNLLIPSIPLTPIDGGMFVPALETVQISSDPKDKEAYKGSQEGVFRLHATALQRIAVAGGLKWMPDLCGFVRSGRAIAYRAVGGVVKAEGDLYTEAGYYDQDPEILRETIEEEYEGKRKNFYSKKDWFKRKSTAEQDDYIKACIARDFRQKRSFRLQLCETGAKNRVIRKIFNVHSEYTTAELAQPFLVLRYRIRIDNNDPEVKRIVMAGALQAAFGVFGGGGQPKQLTAPVSEVDPEADPNLAGYGPGYEAPVYDPDEPASNGDDTPPPEDPELFDFENMPKDEQMNVLREMAVKAGFDSLGIAQQTGKFEGFSRSQYFTEFRRLAAIDDDIPF
jgi:hypothetical protein